MKITTFFKINRVKPTLLVVALLSMGTLQAQKITRLQLGGNYPQIAEMPDGSVVLISGADFTAKYSAPDGKPTALFAPKALIPYYVVTIVKDGQLVKEEMFDIDMSAVMDDVSSGDYLLAGETSGGQNLVERFNYRLTIEEARQKFPGLWIEPNPYEVLVGFDSRSLPNQIALVKEKYIPSPYFNRGAYNKEYIRHNVTDYGLEGSAVRFIGSVSPIPFYGDHAIYMVSDKRKGRENKASTFREYYLETYDLEGKKVRELPVHFEFNTQMARMDVGPDLITGEDMGPVWYGEKTPVLGGGGKNDPDDLRKHLIAADLEGNIRFRHEFRYGDEERSMMTTHKPIDQFWYNGTFWQIVQGAPDDREGLMVIMANEEGITMKGHNEQELKGYYTPNPKVAAAGVSHGFLFHSRHLMPDGSILLLVSTSGTKSVRNANGQSSFQPVYTGYVAIHISAQGDLLYQYPIERLMDYPELKPALGMEYLGEQNGRHIMVVWEPLVGSVRDNINGLSPTIPNPGGNPSMLTEPPVRYPEAKPHLMYFDPATKTSGMMADPFELKYFATHYGPEYWLISEHEGTTSLTIRGSIPSDRSAVYRSDALYTYVIK